MTQCTALLWFRQDLRLKDNPALIHAVQNDYKILPVYILDTEHAGAYAPGGAKSWWLYKSLQCLNKNLDGNLVFRSGKADEIIPELLEQSGARAVFWNRCYEPWRIARDKALKSALEKNHNIDVQTFNASLLWEPWEIKNNQGEPYKVFTPFFRKGCVQHSEPEKPEPAPAPISYADFSPRHDEGALNLLPSIQWYRKFEKYWEPGEDGAQKRLDEFLDNGLKGYKNKRNRPDLDNVSRLSPHLHLGEISPRDVWHAAQAKGRQAHWDGDMDTFLSELGWREFSYSQLYYNPDLMTKPLQEKFKTFPWRHSEKDLSAWQNGQTGIPIVDAGMRQLWETGWMHNRVRMIVASLLIKNMMIHWVEGENWFWDCLVDADLASNSASWQWVAGCGADAAPYFRIFNPVLQGKKFDPKGEYVRKFVPELTALPEKYIHAPWEAKKDDLEQAGIELGKTYPKPIVDLKTSRERALEAFKTL